MKKIIVVMIAISFAFVASSCTATQTNEESASKEVFTEELTEAPTETARPYDEWGFNDLDELGNGLLKIQFYNIDNPEKRYVVSEQKGSQGIKIENGFFLECSWNGETFIPRSTQKYEVVSNDTLYVVMDGNLNIENRKVFQEEGLVIFEQFLPFATLGHVPFSLIDWDRGVETASYNGKEYYVFYLK